MQNLLNKLVNYWKTGKRARLLIIFIAALIIGCPCCVALGIWAENQPDPTPTPTQLATYTSLPTRTHLPTKTSGPTYTPLPTSSPQPTFTSTPLPEPLVYTGSGDFVLDVLKWDGAALLYAQYSGSGNFAIWNYDAAGQRIDLLVNTIGRYEGTLPLDFMGELTTRFEITASGTWQLEIRPLALIRRITIPGPVTGTGDDVVLLTGGIPDTLKADASQASSNFVIWAYGTYRDLLINDIAPYSGTVILPRDTLILQITAEGPWTLEITTK